MTVSNSTTLRSKASEPGPTGSPLQEHRCAQTHLSRSSRELLNLCDLAHNLDSHQLAEVRATIFVLARQTPDFQVGLRSTAQSSGHRNTRNDEAGLGGVGCDPQPNPTGIETRPM